MSHCSRKGPLLVEQTQETNNKNTCKGIFYFYFFRRTLKDTLTAKNVMNIPSETRILNLNP